MMANPSPFQQLGNNVTPEHIKQIAKTGQVPAHLKSAEDKDWMCIFAFYKDSLYSQLSDTPIFGEVLKEHSRKEIFSKILDYIYEATSTDVELDFRKSIVLTEGIPFDKAMDLYNFIKICVKAYEDEIQFDMDWFENLISGKTDEEEEESVHYVPLKDATGFGGNAGTILNNE